MSMLEPKVFANGSTTLPKPVREALGVEVGDIVRSVISEKGVNLFRVPSDEKRVKAHRNDFDLHDALDAAKKVMDENHVLLRKLK